jgi:hypothetical protein
VGGPAARPSSHLLLDTMTRPGHGAAVVTWVMTLQVGDTSYTMTRPGHGCLGGGDLGHDSTGRRYFSYHDSAIGHGAAVVT